MLQTCPLKLPPGISNGITRLGRIWAASSICPRVTGRAATSWTRLLRLWADDPGIPLLVRKGSSIRGSEICHSSGRKIVPCDNSPAQWAYNLAIQGKVPSMGEIKRDFASDRIPVSFAHRKNEKKHRRYHCTLGSHTVNKKKWKLCHIEGVGLRNRQALADVDLDLLKKRFFLLMAPQNHFLLPIGWGGIGEVKEFIRGYSDFR